MQEPRRCRTTGFTLLELMVVIALLSVVGSAQLPSLLKSRAAGHEAAAISHLRALAGPNAMFYQEDIDRDVGYDYSVDMADLPSGERVVHAGPSSPLLGRFDFWMKADGTLLVATCGDGMIQGYEACDPGSASTAAACADASMCTSSCECATNGLYSVASADTSAAAWAALEGLTAAAVQGAIDTVATGVGVGDGNSLLALIPPTIVEAVLRDLDVDADGSITDAELVGLDITAATGRITSEIGTDGMLDTLVAMDEIAAATVAEQVADFQRMLDSTATAFDGSEPTVVLSLGAPLDVTSP